ncbi:ATP-binding protein [Pseudomonas koreensis]|uniref:ATP-binding protein n=1 Tax=Pseudomonas koreensis TaxID=198620 RepID=UPI0010C06F1A|nr:ATP-binding protein [Pseudomonas koreensis]TKJ77783.1 ATP-binding protein [Pseudomonas koreensis]
MAKPISKFSRVPDIRFFEAQCPVHGTVDGAEVEQFDGSYLVRACRRCQWEAMNTADTRSEAHTQALARRKATALNELLIGSGITPRFAECTLGNYRTSTADMTSALIVCQAYADQFEENYRAGRGLLLTGNVGTGKTHLASGIVQQVIRKFGALALIVSAAEIIRIAKGAMVRGAEHTERDVINELAGLDLLVIDEIGAQKGSEYELGLLHEVIDRRYQLVRPTVVVSNLPASTLGQFIGDRALDRLRQNGGQAVGFSWSSMRATA